MSQDKQSELGFKHEHEHQNERKHESSEREPNSNQDNNHGGEQHGNQDGDLGDEQDTNHQNDNQNSNPQDNNQYKPLGSVFTLPMSTTKAYLYAPPTATPATLVLLLTNSLGLVSQNNLRLADDYARVLNAMVVVPDLFDGDPMANTDIPENTSDSTISHVKSLAVSFVQSFFVDMWTARHTFSKTMPRLRTVLSELHTAYAPEKMAVVGYSFGGRYALHLLSEPPGFQSRAWAGSELDTIVCGAVVHPSLVEAAEFEGVERPMLVVRAEHDALFPEEVAGRSIAVLRGNGVECEVQVYQGELPHGFAVPGDYPESVVGQKPKEVFDQVVQWVSQRL